MNESVLFSYQGKYNREVKCFLYKLSSVISFTCITARKWEHLGTQGSTQVCIYVLFYVSFGCCANIMIKRNLGVDRVIWLILLDHRTSLGEVEAEIQRRNLKQKQRRKAARWLIP